MKKKGNITFVVFVALLVICCGAAIVTVATSSKYNSKTEYERMKNRYIAESGVDMAVGLFLNYLENQDYVLAYMHHPGGDYSAMSIYSPYLLNEIRDSSEECVSIDLINAEARDYLVSAGFVDFKRNGEIKLEVVTFLDKDKFKLTEMCLEHDFLISREDAEKKESKLNPIYLTVTATYNGGEVMANMEISNLYAVREPFGDSVEGEQESVRAWIDTERAIIKCTNYQNYGGGEK